MKTKEENKRQLAVALRYAEGDRAPHVLASGAGEIAKRILQLAKENNIPIHEDTSLAELLSKLDVGYEIPPETYKAVAEILAFLYRTDEQWRRKKTGSNPSLAKKLGAPMKRSPMTTSSKAEQRTNLTSKNRKE